MHVVRTRSRAAVCAPVVALLLTLSACGDSKSSSTAPVVSTGLQFTSNPCTNGAAVSLQPAQSIRVDCSNGGNTITLAGGGATYLMVPQFPTNALSAQWYPYTFASGSLKGASADVIASGLAANGARLLRSAGTFSLVTANASTSLDGVAMPRRIMTAQRAADAALRSRARQFSNRVMHTVNGAANISSNASLRAASLRAAQVAFANAVPTVGSLRTFQVANSFSVNTYAAVGAKLAYAGATTWLYVDTLAPAAGFTAAQLQTMGQYFDQVLFPIDTAAFGPPSDVDGNGHIIVLMSPTVNADTPRAQCNSSGFVAGFINEEDFNGPSDVNSNQGEIFYSIAPDPDAQYSCAHTVSDLMNSVPATFLHETEHLINYAQHVVVRGGASGESWADEGLAIVAEELGSRYYEDRCPPPACRTSAAQLFPDSSQGFVSGFLYDSYQFALLPDTASLTMHDDGEDGFSWRGGEWLLMRYLADQLGSNFTRRFITGPSSAITTIEQLTGLSYATVMANFAIALYADSLPGLARTTAPSVNRFSSRNLRQMWARLYVTSGGASDVPFSMPIQLFPVSADTSTAVMSPGAMTYFKLTTTSSSTNVTVRFAAPGGVPLNPLLKPQVAIFRLPPGL